MMRRVCEWLAARLGPPRHIDRDGGPYLDRHYALGGPRDEEPGVAMPKARTARWYLPWGLYLHHFLASDGPGILHNHPWRWAGSLILAGGYVETRLRFEDAHATRRRFPPWRLNFIRHDTFHRVELIEEDCWTLFLAGPKTRSWGFLDPRTGEFEDWKVVRARSKGLRGVS